MCWSFSYLTLIFLDFEIWAEIWPLRLFSKLFKMSTGPRGGTSIILIFYGLDWSHLGLSFFDTQLISIHIVDLAPASVRAGTSFHWQMPITYNLLLHILIHNQKSKYQDYFSIIDGRFFLFCNVIWIKIWLFSKIVGEICIQKPLLPIILKTHEIIF